MIYAVFDFEAETWYLLGAYQTSSEVIEFYNTMLQAPFWRDRLSALYIVGSWNMDTGEILPCEKCRIMVGGKYADSFASVPSDSNSEGAGGAISPQNEQKNRSARRFSFLRNFFNKKRHN